MKLFNILTSEEVVFDFCLAHDFANCIEVTFVFYCMFISESVNPVMYRRRSFSNTLKKQYMLFGEPWQVIEEFQKKQHWIPPVT